MEVWLKFFIYYAIPFVAMAILVLIWPVLRTRRTFKTLAFEIITLTWVASFFSVEAFRSTFDHNISYIVFTSTSVIITIFTLLIILLGNYGIITWNKTPEQYSNFYYHYIIIEASALAIIFTMILSFLKNVYIESGTMYEEEFMILLSQSSSTGIPFEMFISYLRNYFLSCFLPSVLFIFMFFQISNCYITIREKTFFFSFRILPLLYIFSFIITYNQLVKTSSSSCSKYILQTIVHPRSTLLIPPKKKKNIILIGLESIDSYFFSRKYGGMTEPAWIPHLQDLLIDKNNSFFTPSKNGSFGGGQLIFRTRFTIFATFGMVCSVPHISAKFHQAGPEDFYPKMECMGDILKKQGYSTSVTYGSSFFDWNIGYTFLNHSYEKIITNAQMGSRDWVKDFVVFDRFKKELTRLHSLKKPFFAHTLTLDAHQPGLVCKLCPKGGSSNERAVRCTDKQVYNFLEWAKTQPWYNNTLIVIHGDHLNRWRYFRTQADKVGNKRSTYNVWINSAVKPKKQTGRMYSNFDIQPSIYAAAGFKVKGDRIALGTNLFSDKETLMEKFGVDKFEDEIEDTPKWYHSVYDGIQYQSNSNDLVVTGTLGEKDTRGEKKERDYWYNPLAEKPKKPKK